MHNLDGIPNQWKWVPKSAGDNADYYDQHESGHSLFIQL